MRLLLLMQGKVVEDHPGVDDAFRRLRQEGRLEAYEVIPYYGFAQQHGWQGLWSHALQKAEDIEADTVFLQ